MRISVAQDKCVGSGQCVLVASRIFDQREDDGVAVVLDQHPDRASLDDARTAARLCPSHAISVDDG